MSEHSGNGNATAIPTTRRRRTMLAPVAYSELLMPSLRLARSFAFRPADRKSDVRTVAYHDWTGDVRTLAAVDYR